MRLLVLFLLVFLVCAQFVFAQSLCGIRISEFLPNPVGDDSVGEFIELENTCDEARFLDGMSVSDRYGTTKTFTLDGLQIAAHGFLVLMREQTLISLNNDTEQVELTDVHGILVDRSDLYEVVKEGHALARFSDGWHVVLPSMGQANVDPIPSPSSTPTPTPLIQTSPSPSSQPTATANIRLNEVSPCNNSPEWVEFYNKENFTVSLEGWWIQDSTTQKKYLDDIVVPANGYAVFEWNGYFLNNDGDSVRLFLSNRLLDSVTFDGCTDVATWQRFNNDIWIQQTNITKGTSNIEMVETPSPGVEGVGVFPPTRIDSESINTKQPKQKQYVQQELHWLEPGYRQPKVEPKIIQLKKDAYPYLFFFFTSTFFFEAFGGLGVAWYNLKE